jgi:hypothetical protein
MSRPIAPVIAEVLGLLPSPAPASVADGLAVLRSELTLLSRAAAYTPPEDVESAAELWPRLTVALYRYMPAPSAFDWAEAIARVVAASGLPGMLPSASPARTSGS